MNKFFIALVSLLVGLGLGLTIPHGAKVSQSGPVGGSGGVQLDRHFTYGLYAGSTDQFSVDSSGNVTATSFTNGTTLLGSSSSSPAALGAATGGYLTIGTSTPATNITNASTTAVTASSLIFLQQTATTTIPGVTCNAVPATSTIVSVVIPGSGFQIKAGSIPTTNPNCYYFHIRK